MSLTYPALISAQQESAILDFESSSAKKNSSEKISRSGNQDEKLTHTITTYLGKNRSRTDYKYDDSGNVTQEIQSVWSDQNNAWIGITKYDYEYDANNNEKLFVHSIWSEDSNDWINVEKTLSDYNQDGLCTYYASYRWDSSRQDWYCYTKSINEFDANGNKTLSEEYEDIDGSGKLIGSFRSTSIYNSNNIEVQYFEYIWSQDSEEWLNKFKAVYTHYSDLSNSYNETMTCDWDGNDWVISMNVKYAFDQNRNKILDERLYYDNGVFRFGYKESSVYDSKNRLTSNLIQRKTSETQEWQNSSKMESEFTSSTYKKFYFNSIWYGNSFFKWIDHSRTEGFLDSNGNIITSDNYQAKYDEDYNNPTYSLTSKSDYTYDSNQNLILEVVRYYENGSFVAEDKHEYAYDNLNRRTMDAIYKWSNEKGLLYGVSKWERVLNEEGIEIMHATYSWSYDLNNWIGSDKSDKEYGNDGLITRNNSYSWSNEINDWVIKNYVCYTYHENGSPKQELRYTNKEGEYELTSTITYYYGDESGISDVITDNKPFSVNGRNINFEQDNNIQIFTINGQNVYSGKSKSIELPASGIYLIHTTQGVHKIFVR